MVDMKTFVAVVVVIAAVALFGATKFNWNLFEIAGCDYSVTDCGKCGYNLELASYGSFTGETRTPSMEWSNGYTFTCPVNGWENVCPDETQPCHYGNLCRVHFYYEDGAMDTNSCNMMEMGDTCTKGPGKYAVYRVVWRKVCKECCLDPPKPGCSYPDCNYDGECWPNGYNIGSNYCEGSYAKALQCKNGVVSVWSMYCDPNLYMTCDSASGTCKSSTICGNGVCDVNLGECDTCKSDCTPSQCLDKLCGNGVCDSDMGETYSVCPSDCTNEKCYVEGSGCGLGFPYSCCGDLECKMTGIIAGKCVDSSKPPEEQCQKISQQCGGIMGDCCANMECDRGTCREQSVLEKIGWAAIAAGLAGIMAFFSSGGIENYKDREYDLFGISLVYTALAAIAVWWIVSNILVLLAGSIILAALGVLAAPFIGGALIFAAYVVGAVLKGLKGD